MAEKTSNALAMKIRRASRDKAVVTHDILDAASGLDDTLERIETGIVLRRQASVAHDPPTSSTKVKTDDDLFRAMSAEANEASFNDTICSPKGDFAGLLGDLEPGCTEKYRKESESLFPSWNSTAARMFGPHEQ